MSKKNCGSTITSQITTSLQALEADDQHPSEREQREYVFTTMSLNWGNSSPTQVQISTYDQPLAKRAQCREKNRLRRKNLQARLDWTGGGYCPSFPPVQDFHLSPTRKNMSPSNPGDIVGKTYCSPSQTCRGGGVARRGLGTAGMSPLV